ncbi:MAG: hypothetical protein AVDCRST_MAG19-3567, partial [uncultured Thermomicrobiales bacterium]
GHRAPRAHRGRRRPAPLLPPGHRVAGRRRGGGRGVRRLVQDPGRPDPAPHPQPARHERRAGLRLRHRRPLPARAAGHLPPPQDPAPGALRGRRAARNLHVLPRQPRLRRRVSGGGPPHPERV